mgnify:FL=1
MSSLRSKILAAFWVPMVALLVFTVIVIADLYYLNNRILEGAKINKFYVATQEMRRDEKNLFLYHTLSDYTRSMQQLQSVEDAFKDSSAILSDLANVTERAELEQTLLQYRIQLEQYLDKASRQTRDHRDEIRGYGQELLEWARELGERERTSLAQYARVAANAVLTTLFIVIILGVISVTLIVRQVARPLRDLSNQLDAVADGSITEMTPNSNDEEIQSVVMHFNDMLARTRSQQTRLRKHEKAAALGVLASGVAHELNNPLSNISTSVQLLQESTDDSEKELRDQWMTHIDQETERARRIVRRLLDSARQPKLQVQKYEFPALIESSVALVTGQLPESVRVHIVNAPDRRMYVDGERMKQVFINLVKNAANAGAQNIWINASVTTWAGMGNAITGEMHGETCQINQPGPVLRVDISDDGPGIADDHLAQIFDPFFTTQTGHDGIGLGLYLVKEIISEHDACIAVDNRSEGGAQFTIGIPLPNEEETE